MRKVKILQFPIANSNGGITHYALNNWKYMDKNQFQCDFATMSKKIDFSNEIIETGSKIHYISCYAEKDERQFCSEIETILDEGYDVVHLHTKQWKSYLVEKICSKRGVPKIIVHAHSTKCDNADPLIREEETRQHLRVRKSLTPKIATDFWACSLEAAEWLYSDRIPRECIKIIPNAIETEKFYFRDDWRYRVRNKLSIPKDAVVIGNVGRLAYPKNQEFLIESFAEAKEENKKLVLMIVGDGEKRDALEKLVEKLGVRDSVIFIGFCKEVNQLYSAMDIFALSSQFEGFPLTVIEAQTAGLPVLCMDSITRSINVSNNVRFVTSDISIWKKEILKMASSPINCGRREKGFLVDDAGYSIKEQIQQIEREYMSAVKNG